MTAGSPFGGGFAEPVFGSQAVFRAVLDAMARPGTIAALAADARPPAPLTAELASVLLALADADTPVFLDAPLAAAPEIARYLAFHTGAPTTADPAAATFAAVADPMRMPPLAAFAQGTDAYPDRSTTLVVAVERLGATADDAAFRLAGPGIEGVARLAASPLPAGFARQWAANRGLFPCGVDVVLTAPGVVAALPRSTTLTTAER